MSQIAMFRTAMFQTADGRANPLTFDVPIVLYQASYA